MCHTVVQTVVQKGVSIVRVSRMVTKERLRETIEEALDNAPDMDSTAWQKALQSDVDTVTDAVWSLLGELDSEDDFGATLREEDD